MKTLLGIFNRSSFLTTVWNFKHLTSCSAGIMNERSYLTESEPRKDLIENSQRGTSTSSTRKSSFFDYRETEPQTRVIITGKIVIIMC